MSIEKRSSQFFKVREDLNRTETAWRNIKVLTDLRILSVHRSIDMKVLTDLNGIFHLHGISEMQAE